MQSELMHSTRQQSCSFGALHPDRAHGMSPQSWVFLQQCPQPRWPASTTTAPLGRTAQHWFVYRRPRSPSI